MKKLKVIHGLLAVLVILPIWFYLMYQVLERVNASELMWFLYWVYLPASVLVTGIGKIIEE